MKEPLFLGIDGGGSTCRARICTAAGHLIGEATGGPASIYRNQGEAIASILATAISALEAGGCTKDDLPRLHTGLGLAGITTYEMARAVEKLDWPFAQVTADNDAYIACLGAHAGKDGGIVITGTGSAALAVVKGRRYALGGWGFQIGDDGSGGRIGQAALRRAVLAGDGLVPTSSLLSALLASFGNSNAKITAWARRAEAGDYAAYVPQVLAAGDKGDPEASRILRDAGASLSDMLLVLKGHGAARLSLVGGLSQAIVKWLPTETQALVSAPLGDAVAGAILMARHRQQSNEAPQW